MGVRIAPSMPTPRPGLKVFAGYIRATNRSTGAVYTQPQAVTALSYLEAVGYLTQVAKQSFPVVEFHEHHTECVEIPLEWHVIMVECNSTHD